jgi:hypothetical protein
MALEEIEPVPSPLKGNFFLRDLSRINPNKQTDHSRRL